MLTPLLLVLQCPALCNTWTMDSRTFYLYIVVLVECIAFLESIRVPSCLRGDSLHRPCVVSILGCELSSRPTYISRTTCRSWIPCFSAVGAVALSCWCRLHPLLCRTGARGCRYMLM
ncbi:hypothetical protein B0H10DRAFT_977769 [Mycena sp. CBHHK59/15]|nr:hypothetical protein B0H10DRAFT_977769 [Mycena sp. CBHHK59/15]